MKIFLILLFSPFSWAQSTKAPLTEFRNKNCHIQITTTTKNDGERISTRRFNFDTKSECEKMNRILSDNMNPSEIVKVETKFEWSGK